jgi:hypothetical protein
MADLTESSYVASRPISIGPYVFAPGEQITVEALRVLPPRRLGLLVDQGWLDKVPVAL